jgi:lysophospholipase L1-like esterase
MSIGIGVRAATLAALASFALVLAPQAHAATVGGTYLALGDSLAYGYHQAQFQSEYPNVNPASFNDGYVDDFSLALRAVNKSVQTINDGCPGETSDTLINGSGLPGYCAGGPTGTPFPYAFLHHPYGASTQLRDALAVIAAHPNVNPITLDIGANDVLQFLRATCGFPAAFTCTPAQVGAEFTHIAANVATILGTLRAAAPHAQIVLAGLYNPYPAVLPAPGGDYLLGQLNSAFAAVAAHIPGTSFANPEPYFNPAGTAGKAETGDVPVICELTAMCPGGTYSPASPQADIHPTKLGYAVYAGVVAASFFSH